MNNGLLFGRFSREDCGLPPVATGRTLGRKTLRVIVLFAVLVGAGWLAGQASARYREFWLAALPSRVALAAAVAPDEAAGLLARGKFYAMALPARTGMRRDLAFAVLAAAENAPRPAGYYGNAAALLAGYKPEDNPAVVFAAETTAASLSSELGDFPNAFARLERAEAALSMLPDGPEVRGQRLLLVNNQAYCLATAPADMGRNPEKALHLAQLVVTSRDVLPDGGSASASAAFVDTLASAWAAAGEYGEALKTQEYALGLADGQGLDVYIRHFDEFRRGTDNGE